MSLNKKNCLGLGFLRQILVNTPSPTNTRPGTANGCNHKYGHPLKLYICCRITL